jgi:hypothetical protein
MPAHDYTKQVAAQPRGATVLCSPHAAQVAHRLLNDKSPTAVVAVRDGDRGQERHKRVVRAL